MGPCDAVGITPSRQLAVRLSGDDAPEPLVHADQHFLSTGRTGGDIGDDGCPQFPGMFNRVVVGGVEHQFRDKAALRQGGVVDLRHPALPGCGDLMADKAVTVENPVCLQVSIGVDDEQRDALRNAPDFLSVIEFDLPLALSVALCLAGSIVGEVDNTVGVGAILAQLTGKMAKTRPASSPVWV